MTNIAPARVPFAGIRVIASVIFSPSGAFQSLGTSIVVHWKPSLQAVQFSAAVVAGGVGGAVGGGVAGAPVQAAAAGARQRASAAAPPIGRKPRIVRCLPRCPFTISERTGGGQWPWTRRAEGA